MQSIILKVFQKHQHDLGERKEYEWFVKQTLSTVFTIQNDLLVNVLWFWGWCWCCSISRKKCCQKCIQYIAGCMCQITRLPCHLGSQRTWHEIPIIYFLKRMIFFFPINRLIYLCIIKVEVTTFERLKGSDLEWSKHIKILVYRVMSL